MAASDAKAPSAGTDPLKIYCWIFVLLVVLLTVLLFWRRSDRKAMEAANVAGRAWLEESDNKAEDRPNDIPRLAFEVEQYAEAFEMSGGEADARISAERMEQLITKAGMARIGVRAQPVDPNASRGYQTISEIYEFGPSTLENLVTLAYNVDNTTRYRVMEMNFKMLSEKEGNNAPPFHKIGRSTMKVAMRTAIRRGE
jgi:hypothetical protein